MQVDTTSSVLIRTTSCFLNICVGFEAEEGGIEEGKDREREGETETEQEQTSWATEKQLGAGGWQSGVSGSPGLAAKRPQQPTASHTDRNLPPPRPRVGVYLPRYHSCPYENCLRGY